MSDGALSFYHDRFVRTRISKFTYGAFLSTRFDPAAPDHQQRLYKVYTSDNFGDMRIKDSFHVILPKVASSSFVIAHH